ncbi:MAG: hypothetical protein H7A24_15945 [Leptospiraceae bacterium]|nr:hypothetical protein [Leptospiraceae bacterium]MCP5513379.1 hypothetical protein [Leptospiraceae bacterium]
MFIHLNKGRVHLFFSLRGLDCPELSTQEGSGVPCIPLLTGILQILRRTLPESGRSGYSGLRLTAPVMELFIERGFFRELPKLFLFSSMTSPPYP